MEEGTFTFRFEAQPEKGTASDSGEKERRRLEDGNSYSRPKRPHFPPRRGGGRPSTPNHEEGEEERPQEERKTNLDQQKDSYKNDNKDTKDNDNKEEYIEQKT